MALNSIPCPECGAGLKSPSGFKVGQTVCCPKCETYFSVEEPPEKDEEVEEKELPKKKPAATTSSKAKTAGKKPLKAAALRDDDDEEDDEDEDRPKKKKKKRRDDSEQSYKSSPLRYAILGVLVVVMLVLGYFLYDKHKNQQAADDEAVKVIEPRASSSAPELKPVQPKGPGGQRPKQGGPVNLPANPGGPLPNQPKQNGPVGRTPPRAPFAEEQAADKALTGLGAEVTRDTDGTVIAVLGPRSNRSDRCRNGSFEDANEPQETTAVKDSSDR